MRCGLRLRQRDSARARCRLRHARLPGTCPAAPATVDEQAVDRIWHAVQGRAYGWQAAERLPPFLILKADLEHHAPAARMPRPVDSAIRQRRLDQRRVVLLLPPESRKLAVQYLDRPPFSHCGDSTPCPLDSRAPHRADLGGRATDAWTRRSPQVHMLTAGVCPAAKSTFSLLNQRSIGRRHVSDNSGSSHSHNPAGRAPDAARHAVVVSTAGCHIGEHLEQRPAEASTGPVTPNRADVAQRHRPRYHTE